MTSSIFIKRSSLSGSIPATSILSPGELAINIGDGGLYYENATSSLVELIRAGTASFALTAAFAETGVSGGGGGGGETRSGSFTGSFTGSLLGTASWADNVISASHAVTAAFALNAGAGGSGGGSGGGDVVTSSYTFFDPDFQDPVFTDAHNDEFDISGTLKSIWTKQNFAETTASIEHNILTLTGGSVTLTVRRLEQRPSGSAWTMRAKVAYRGNYIAQGYIGIFVGNDSNTRLEIFGLGHSSAGNPTTTLFTFNSPTSFNSTVFAQVVDVNDQTDWAYFEIHYDGVNILYRQSWNGISWSPYNTRTTGSFLDAAVDRIGIWAFGDTSVTEYTSSVDWFRFITGSQKTGKHLNNAERTVITGVTGGGLAQDTILIRESMSLDTAIIASGSTVTGTVELAKSFELLNVSASSDTRIRLYTTPAFRDADLTRQAGIDPLGEHGVILDLVLTGSFHDWQMAPIVLGASLESPPSAAIAYSVKNQTAGAISVSVEFTKIINQDQPFGLGPSGSEGPSGSGGPSGSEGPSGSAGGFGGAFSGSFSGSFTGTFIGNSDATGTLLGTASWAENVISASHALVADSADLATSAVIAITASNADTASFANPSLFTAHRPMKTVANTNPYDVIFPDATILINATSGTAPIVVQLPGTAIFMNGPHAKILTVIKSAGGNDVEVVASGTENVTGDPSASLVSQYQSVTLQPSGGTWWAL